MILVDLIDTHGRLREPDAAKVQAIAASISEVGLLNPITVSPCSVTRNGYQKSDGFRLVAGGHRLEAIKSLGWREAPATVVDLGEHERVIAECDENLCGSNLSPSEVAMFTAKRKAAYEALHPETAHGTNQHARSRQVGDSSESPQRFTENSAAATGMSERAVQRNASRGEQITMAALEMVKGTKLDKGTFLDMLKKVPAEQQVSFVKKHMTQAQPFKSAREKPAVKSDAEVVADEVADMVRRWNKLSPEGRAMFLDEIDTPVMDRGAA